MKSDLIHVLSDVQSSHIGSGTRIWQFCVVLPEAVIGNNCNINCQVLIENDVVIGDNVTIKPGVQIWDGITIEDNVFIGPNVTFTNDKYPRSKQYPDEFSRTIISHNSSIGANATVLSGLTVGSFALIGAGAVVTKDVPSYAVVTGNPARIAGWVDEKGNKLSRLDNDNWESVNGEIFLLSEGILKRI